MLKTRILTALVLLAILLPALFWPSPIPFAVAALVLMTAAAWEWARLNGITGAGAVATAAACLGLCAASWQLGMLAKALPLLWAAVGAAWVLAGTLLVRAGVQGWPRIPRFVRLAGGVLALWAAWLAAAQAR